MLRALAISLLLFSSLAFAQSPQEDDARNTLERFESSIEHHDLAGVERVVAADLVVFENGERNDGWADFRDNHLKIEFEEPLSKSQTKLERLEVSGSLAWAYSNSLITPHEETDPRFELWSAYVLQRKDNIWKIAMLSWSIRRIPLNTPSATPAQKPSGCAKSRDWNFARVQDSLKKEGLKFKPGGSVRQPFISVPGRLFLIGAGEAEIQTYTYSSAAARERDTDKLDPQKVVPPGTSVLWIMPPTLIANRNLALIVLTRDEELRARLQQLFAGQNCP